jgi:tRNA dimethylallyltransferase
LRKAVVVCGPTAAGKSALADALAEEVSGMLGQRLPCVLVDSMQVYRELPVITNQARARPAELCGVVSVAEDWNVARHRDAALGIEARLPEGAPLVLDAGTGMYLNAIVLDLRLAPKVPPAVRNEARRLVSSGIASGEGRDEGSNPRRLERRVELSLVGAEERGSVWSAPLRYDALFFYLRPPRSSMDANIARRSAGIVRDGLPEAEALVGAMEGGLVVPNPSVLEAVGVREMLMLAGGRLGMDEAEEEISSRTRRLARKQLRWFDKLCRTLGGPEGPGGHFVVLEGGSSGELEAAKQRMRATIGA